MKILSLILIFFSFTTYGAIKIECVTQEHQILISSEAELKLTYNGESVVADGIANSEQVDLVARFKSIGEMTLFAKVGKTSPENYIFIQMKRFSVQCR